MDREGKLKEAHAAPQHSFQLCEQLLTFELKPA